MIKKLSQVKRPSRYCMCVRCIEGYENDVDTNHAICPTCGSVMQNMSREAMEATIAKETKMRKEVARP